MTIAKLEEKLLAELIEVTKNDRLKLFHIMEYSTGKVSAKYEDEKEIYLPKLKYNVVYLDLQ